MFGMIKMLPLLLAVVGSAYGYHTVKVNEYEATIARLEANIATLKANYIRMEEAFEREQLARQRSEENLQIQLKAVGELTEKNTEMQREMDDYLSIFKRHNLTQLARAKPGLIEPRINKGTAEVFRAIEEDSKEVENADSL